VGITTIWQEKTARRAAKRGSNLTGNRMILHEKSFILRSATVNTLLILWSESLSIWSIHLEIFGLCLFQYLTTATIPPDNCGNRHADSWSYWEAFHLMTTHTMIWLRATIFCIAQLGCRTVAAWPKTWSVRTFFFFYILYFVHMN